MNLYDLFDESKPCLITYKKSETVKYGFVLDAVTSLTHSNTATVSSFTIEDGTQINDNVVLEPRVLTLAGIISDTPYKLFNFNLPFSTADKISKKAYDIFQEIFENKYLVSIETDLENYDDMYIESMTFPRSADTQKVLEFTLNLKKLKFVSSQLADLPDSYYKKDVVAKVTGKKTTNITEKKPIETGKDKSTLFITGAKK